MTSNSIWNCLPDSVETQPATDHPELLAPSTAQALANVDGTVEVFAIDPDLADTAALTEAYGLSADASANCVLVAARRGDDEKIAACVVLAHTKADINKRVRKLLEARKASFLPMDRAVEESGMEYGGIGPIGLPADYRVLIDARVAAAPEIILGSGIRGSKLVLSGATLADITGVEVVDDLAIEIG